MTICIPIRSQSSGYQLEQGIFYHLIAGAGVELKVGARPGWISSVMTCHFHESTAKATFNTFYSIGGYQKKKPGVLFESWGGINTLGEGVENSVCWRSKQDGKRGRSTETMRGTF